MIKKRTIVFIICLLFSMLQYRSINAMAADEKLFQSSDLEIVSITEDEFINGNEKITTITTVYEQGFVEVETLTVLITENAARSIAGVITAKKQKTITSDDVTIFDVTFNATFSWDGDQANCTAKSNSYTLIKTYEVANLEMSSGVYTIFGIPYGTAYADLDYHVCLKNAAFGYFKGTITIDCTKNGKVS